MKNFYKKIAFLGAGKMSSALIDAFVNKSSVNPRHIIATDISSSRRKFIDRKYRRYGLDTTQDNISAVKKSEVIFLCVKPKDIGALLDEISTHINPSKHLVVSIAAGITTRYIESRLPEKTKVVRTMPNTPISVGEGVLFLARGRYASNREIDFVTKLFSPVALVLKVKNEDMINSATAISGSGPAYIYYFAEALRDAALSLGFNRKVASNIVIKTFIGASRMMSDGIKKGRTLEDLRADVTSPGGTTFEAIKSFEKDNLKEIILRAAHAARRRARELSS